MEEKRDLKPIIIYLVVNFVLGIVLGIVLAILKLDINQYATPATVLLSFIIIAIFIIFYYKRLITDTKKLDKKKLINTFIFLLITLAISNGLSEIFVRLGVTFENQNNLETMFSSFKIPMIIYIALFAPIIEEFVFRYSFGTFIKNKIAFIIISGIVFGLFHSTGIDIIIYALIGSLLAYVYIKNDKNIVCPIILHIINNALSVIIMLLTVK